MFTIGLFDKSIGFLETDKENKISFAKIITSNFELDNLFKENKLSESALSNTADIINGVLEDSKTSSNISRLLIDTDKCFVNVIPLDFSENKDKINSNILWELSNYYPESYKDFKISYHKLLSKSYSDSIKETLIIGIRNSVIAAAKKLSGLLNIKITSIDIEHFAAEKYFRSIRKNLFKDESILIIGSKKNRFDLSIINDTGCFAYEYFIMQETNFQEKLLKVYSKLDEKFRSLKIKNIYLYGDESTANVYKIINDLSQNTRVILSNPFYEIGITDKISPETVSEGYKFIPLCGLASEEKK